MNKSTESSGPGKAPARARKRQKSPISFWERIPFGAYIVIGALAVLGLGIGLPVYFGNRHMSNMDMSSPKDSRPSTGVGVGEMAPGFTLKDVAGQGYTLNPGDGKGHVLVFYMGYF